MSKLILVLGAVFCFSCGNIGDTSKNRDVTKVEKTPTREVVNKTEKVEKVYDIQVDDEIVETSSADKMIVKNSVNSNVEETKIEEEVIETPLETVVTKEKEVDEVIVKTPTAETPITEEKKETPILSVGKIDLWNELLTKHVNTNGDVDYKAFLKDKGKLQVYLDYLAQNSPGNEWSNKEKLVYYINIYNAGTVKLILDNYPTKSIKDINKPWAKEIIKIGENNFSLGDIEHKILRKMNEPRIHFAINCASYSCPKLINKAFTVANLEKMLEVATVDFINDSKRNKITADKLQLSNIFKWYKKDFTDKGTLIEYINPYFEIDIEKKANISYLKYDWSLNEAK